MPNPRVPAAGIGLPGSTPPQRRLEAAVFDHGVGVVTAVELVAMQEGDWGHLRARITDRRNGDPSGFRARCMACGGDVFIAAIAKGGLRLPMFKHYESADAPPCAWRHDLNENVERLRAQQYDGRQESPTHRMLCEAIAEMARRDPRCEAIAINAYRPPSQDERGRFPDVRVTLAGLGEFVFEVQLSHTWASEISARCVHYQREGARLIWILAGVDLGTPLSQDVRDILGRHRGTAFMLDQAAFAAARERGTIILSAFVRDAAGGFGPRRLTALDDLICPESGCPYLEDAEIAQRLVAYEERRAPWRRYLRARVAARDARLDETPEVTALLAALPEAGPTHGDARDDVAMLIEIIAAAMTIQSAAMGEGAVYLTRCANVKAVLNTVSRRPHIARCAALLKDLLKRTPLFELLSGSVGRHLNAAAARFGVEQPRSAAAEAKALAYLFPEIFEPAFRGRLADLGALADWARGDERGAAGEGGVDA